MCCYTWLPLPPSFNSVYTCEYELVSALPGAEVTVSCKSPSWVLGTELRSPTRSGPAFKQKVISPASFLFLKFSIKNICKKFVLQTLSLVCQDGPVGSAWCVVGAFMTILDPSGCGRREVESSEQRPHGSQAVRGWSCCQSSCQVWLLSPALCSDIFISCCDLVPPAGSH